MTKVKIFSQAWFDMVTQANKQTELSLPPTIKDICLNLVITSEQEDAEDNQLYLHTGYLYQGLHDEAKSQVQLTYATMQSLLEDTSMDNAMRAFIRGDILVTGDMSQLMTLQMAKITDEQKVLFNTILENTEI